MRGFFGDGRRHAYLLEPHTIRRAAELGGRYSDIETKERLRLRLSRKQTAISIWHRRLIYE